MQETSPEKRKQMRKPNPPTVNLTVPDDDDDEFDSAMVSTAHWVQTNACLWSPNVANEDIGKLVSPLEFFIMKEICKIIYNISIPLVENVLSFLKK